MNQITSFRLCKLSNEELLSEIDKQTDQMYINGKIPDRQIPARPDKDYDLLVGELLLRFKALDTTIASSIEEAVGGEADKCMLDWLQSIMTNDNEYCEVFFAGLRDFNTGEAQSFQIESNPERFPTDSGKNIRDAILKAMAAYNPKNITQYLNSPKSKKEASIIDEFINSLPWNEKAKIGEYNLYDLIKSSIEYGSSQYKEAVNQPISEEKKTAELSSLAESEAIKSGYHQSDKTQFTTTPWMEHNIFVKGFIKGYNAKQPATVAGGAVWVKGKHPEKDGKYLCEFNQHTTDEGVPNEFSLIKWRSEDKESQLWWDYCVIRWLNENPTPLSVEAGEGNKK